MKFHRPAYLLLLGALALWFGPGAALSQAPQPVSGQVISSKSGPMPGVTISLVHPASGRITPATSGQNGAYSFANVPPQTTPYFVEAYSGTQLIFRQPLTYTGGSVVYNIQVP